MRRKPGSSGAYSTTMRRARRRRLQISSTRRTSPDPPARHGHRSRLAATRIAAPAFSVTNSMSANWSGTGCATSRTWKTGQRVSRPNPEPNKLLRTYRTCGSSRMIYGRRSRRGRNRCAAHTPARRKADTGTGAVRVISSRALRAADAAAEHSSSSMPSASAARMPAIKEPATTAIPSTAMRSKPPCSKACRATSWTRRCAMNSVSIRRLRHRQFSTTLATQRFRRRRRS
jgi:hypothetical protein